ncbi:MULTISPECIES: hypothetical protein [Blautia]|jgi:hypothetical protein|uniref:Uncharacterized protein n=1 Tax=Blautia segnis TaxID=2763030 RepID=A0A8I0AF82_9FIRM|nr:MULTISPECIES: hypothetical protein [Blautia]MBC5652646.1 hypothetical protein [Blautia segnis]NSL05592.1 hypothetical protein [Blautia glucerasea]
MKMESETKDKKKNTASSGKIKLLRSIIMLAAIAALIAGFTYAWFFNRMDMATLMKILPPSNISILGPSGKKLDSLELTYNEGDEKDTNGTVTIRRVFCVESTGSFKLEIAHTTNLKGLKFNLYRANQVNSSDTGSAENKIVTAKDNSKYSYQENDRVAGSYINKIDSTSEYLYADQTYHGINYGNYDNVQAHAEPIYWLAGAKANNYSLDSDSSNRVEITDENGTKTEYHHTYFVCEISWTETTKETDLFYIFAENADVQ